MKIKRKLKKRVFVKHYAPRTNRALSNNFGKRTLAKNGENDQLDIKIGKN